MGTAVQQKKLVQVLEQLEQLAVAWRPRISPYSIEIINEYTGICRDENILYFFPSSRC